MTKEELVEKLKGASPEERTLFRDALSEAEPASFLSSGELSTVREMLAGYTKTKTKTKKEGGMLDFLKGV